MFYKFSYIVDTCSDGMTSETGLAPCTECPKDHYWLNRSHCEPCPPGQITVNPGAISLSKCLSEFEQAILIVVSHKFTVLSKF